MTSTERTTALGGGEPTSANETLLQPATVAAWLEETDGDGDTRMARLVEDLEIGADIIPWLEAAFALGQAAQQEAA